MNKIKQPIYALTKTHLRQLLELSDFYRDKEGYINYKTITIKNFLASEKPINERTQNDKTKIK